MTFLIALMSTVLICGCDVVTGEKARVSQIKAIALTSEIETIKDQNDQLTKMLEESESKLAVKASKLEQTDQQLQDALAANAELETRLSATNGRLQKAGELAGQIETSFKENIASLEKQIQSLGQILPQTADATVAQHDPAAEQTAENSDDHGDKK